MGGMQGRVRVQRGATFHQKQDKSGYQIRTRPWRARNDEIYDYIDVPRKCDNDGKPSISDRRHKKSCKPGTGQFKVKRGNDTIGYLSLNDREDMCKIELTEKRSELLMQLPVD